MNIYYIQKDQSTTVQSIQAGGPICHDQICGAGLEDADCGCGLQHAHYTNPVWQLALAAVPTDEDATTYTFGTTMPMVVSKDDCFETQAEARAECEARN